MPRCMLKVGGKQAYFIPIKYLCVMSFGDAKVSVKAELIWFWM